MSDLVIHISIHDQKLFCIANSVVIADYCVSTARNGAGEVVGSECTPRGKHKVRAKIGNGYPEGSVFMFRRPTGELYSDTLDKQYPDRDWIITRIIWLSGCEPGKNRFGNVDTMRRYIYIHGTPHEYLLGTPFSHGCICMANKDVIELFNKVEIGTPVFIHEDAFAC